MSNIERIEKDFSNSFNGRKVPSSLLKLIEFEEKIGLKWYSSGFERRIDSDRDSTYYFLGSKDPILQDSLFEFANASGDGSSYAFWLIDGNDDLEIAPICAMGSEGDVSIIAHNIIELFQMITYDSEPMICGSWDDGEYIENETIEDTSDPDYVKAIGSIYFNRKYDFDDEEETHCEKHSEYVDWLKDNFDLDPITDPTILMEMSKKAQDKYQKRFKSFLKKYFEEGEYS